MGSALDPIDAAAASSSNRIRQRVLSLSATHNVDYSSACERRHLLVGATRLKAEVLVADPGPGGGRHRPRFGAESLASAILRSRPGPRLYFELDALQALVDRLPHLALARAEQPRHEHFDLTGDGAAHEGHGDVALTIPAAVIGLRVPRGISRRTILFVAGLTVGRIHRPTAELLRILSDTDLIELLERHRPGAVLRPGR